MVTLKRKPSRRVLYLYHRKRFIFVVTSILIFSYIHLKPFLRRRYKDFKVWRQKHQGCYDREKGIQWKPSKVMSQPRHCPQPNYTVIDKTNAHPSRICITTLRDKPWWWQISCRNFKNVDNFPGIQAYAQEHGYFAKDNSALIDSSRPPAWSKIHAVRHMLDLKENQEPRCDWVWWMDADVVIMNDKPAIESFLPADPDIHLLVTHDRKFIANSGSWLIRNTQWSRSFLDEWWNRRSFVRARGLSLSGDNAAFGDVMKSLLPDTHISMVPRCQFNSFALFYDKVDNVTDENPELFYHLGDLAAHASGIDQKEAAVQILLNSLREKSEG